MSVNSALGWQEVGFLEVVPEDVDPHSLSLYDGGTALTCRAVWLVPSGLPSEMRFEGYTSVSLSSKQGCPGATCSGFFTGSLFTST